MEDTSTSAIYTGAFILIFVSSLTIALFLFNNVVTLADTAYEFNTNIDSNKTIVNVPVGKNLLITPEEVASYYYNYIKYDLFNASATADEESISDDNENKKNFEVTIYDNSNNLLNEVSDYQTLMEKLNGKTYILTYDYVDTSNKAHITIKPATDEQINDVL